LEVYGAAMFSDFGKRELTPLEALAGLKYGVDGWYVGAAVGPGLTQGYGSPDVRALLTLSLSPEEPVAAPVVVVVEEEEGPADTDRDGLLDPDDQCPRQPEDLDDFEDEDGCPDPDNDQDGILDRRDGCQLDPEDKYGFEDADGCPDPDNDQDGILDTSDACPLQP
jgi:hypothetical protein